MSICKNEKIDEISLHTHFFNLNEVLKGVCFAPTLPSESSCNKITSNEKYLTINISITYIFFNATLCVARCSVAVKNRIEEKSHSRI